MNPEDLEAGDGQNPARYPGIARTAWGNRWFAQVQHAGVRHYLGTYDTPEEAHEVYRQVKTKLVGGI